MVRGPETPEAHSLEELLSSRGVSDGFVVFMEIGVRLLTVRSGLSSGTLLC